VLSPLASVLRLASVVACLIVIVSFALFVVDQTGNASAHQHAVVNAAAPGSAAAPTSQTTPASSKDGESSARKTIDEAAEAVTSPFSFATEATSSEWLSRGIGLLLTLFFYGFVLGFITRMIRVRL
jgi:predicted PurR-regulated permease PerM